MAKYASAQDAARAAAEAAQTIRRARETIAQNEPLLAEAREEFERFLSTEPRDPEPLRPIGLTVVENEGDAA